VRRIIIRRIKFFPREFEEFKIEIQKRQWNKLITSCPCFPEETVREFYANIYPVDSNGIYRYSWVREVLPYLL